MTVTPTWTAPLTTRSSVISPREMLPSRRVWLQLPVHRPVYTIAASASCDVAWTTVSERGSLAHTAVRSPCSFAASCTAGLPAGSACLPALVASTQCVPLERARFQPDVPPPPHARSRRVAAAAQCPRSSPLPDGPRRSLSPSAPRKTGCRAAADCRPAKKARLNRPSLMTS